MYPACSLQVHPAIALPCMLYAVCISYRLLDAYVLLSLAPLCALGFDLRFIFVGLVPGSGINCTAN